MSQSEAAAAAAAAHRRSVGSSGILSRLSFLRPQTAEDGRSPPTSAPTSPVDNRASSTSPEAQIHAVKNNRSRKGSLRKIALLSTGRPRLGSTLEIDETLDEVSEFPAFASEDVKHDERHLLTPDSLAVAPGTARTTPSPTENGSSSLGDGITVRTSTAATEVSTTDEDDLSPVGRPHTRSSDSTGDSLSQRRLSKPRPSPLSGSPIDASSYEDEWDYSETEWWGWVVLFVTWAVFVVGMGSCFDVWSWAWDVGRVPDAPIELSDDMTLPIVGYYPALIVLTVVMAWVWVVIAWVGMKYFKHAKMVGED